MRGLDIHSFIQVYVDGGEDPMKDYETVKEAIEMEELTKAAIAAQMEQMAAAKGGGNKKEERRRKKEEAKRMKEEEKRMRKSKGR